MTNNKKQTAVEWYTLELQKFLKGESRYKDSKEIYIIAEEINKYQIINAHIGDGTTPEHRNKAEQYYEQTYGGGNI